MSCAPWSKHPHTSGKRVKAVQSLSMLFQSDHNRVPALQLQIQVPALLQQADPQLPALA